MKKVININFQGQVIPIEESAYEMLQMYVASLRKYFADEEGRDEIINDIESRIAELFAEQLKKGAPCITDNEVLKVMESMGRPEDFEAADEDGGKEGKKSGSQTSSEKSTPDFEFADTTGRGRLYRNEQDKIIGGVASGLANYFKIDPAIIRVIFVALFFGGGSGLLVYIILWIILPSRSLINNVRKRLYRDPDEKVIGGVAGGLAKYFDISPAIPRVIFAAPFILAIITSIWDSMFSFFPSVISGFGGGTFIMAYIILWIVLPEARTAAEKLEMRGEKVDLNSIRDTVVSDLEGLKTKAEAAGKDITEKAQKFTKELQQNISDKQQVAMQEMRYASSSSRNGIAEVLTILVKAFVYFIVGIVAFALFMASIGLLVGGVSVYPLHNFVLSGPVQTFAAWGTILLFLGVPVIALLVFIIRRLMRVKKSNPYIGYTFAALWFVGLFSFITLIGSLNRSFSTQVGVKQEITVNQPQNNTLYVKVAEKDTYYYNSWFDFDGNINLKKDTLFLNTVKVNVEKSKDGAYHAHMMLLSKGNDNEDAEQRAQKISFPIIHRDSLLILPAHFAVTKDDKWRNQKIVVVIEVPEGSYIQLDESINDYEYFDVHFNRRNRRGDWDFDWENETRYIKKGVPLQMNDGRLEREENNVKENEKYEYRKDTEELKRDSSEESSPVIEKKEETIYRYSMNSNSSGPALISRLRIKTNPLNAMLRF
jgi:phage shock protein PspC (stress-responsive transcriptional regulator)